MAIRTSSTRRQRIIEFATPKVADLVVVEVVDASKNINAASIADDTAYGTAHPDDVKFPNYKLALIKSAGDENGQYQNWYYVVDRANQDDYNWEFQAAGGSNPRYDTVVRTYVTLRSSYDESSPAIGNSNGMPTVSADPFTNTGSDYDNNYVLFEKRQVRSGDETLDSLYVTEQHVFVKRTPIRRVDTDDSFPYDVAYDGSAIDDPRGALVTKETLWHRDETIKATKQFVATGDTQVAVTGSVDAEQAFRDPDLTYPSGIVDEVDSGDDTNFWGVDELGIMREGKQLSDNWYALVEKQVVPKVGTLTSYFTQQVYTWPAVLNGDADFGDEDLRKGGIVGFTWQRRAGGGDTVVLPVYKRDDYRGPTKVKIEVSWTKKAVAEGDFTPIKPMIPLPINFVTPLATCNVKPTLHNPVELNITTGNEHPKWKLAGATFRYPRTNYTDWPDSLVISDSQEPFRGGFLRTKITAYKPDTTTLVG
tara:strand:+ start:9276 stop:10709 length:1434 start_codon:yes stop_codon:yes gene_type:complete